MNWEQPRYKPGPWKLWFCWHRIVAIDTGRVHWLEFVYRKPCPWRENINQEYWLWAKDPVAGEKKRFTMDYPGWTY